jgi:hypothetical protein
MKYKFLFIVVIFINGFVIFSQQNIVPEKLMWVNSKEGLRKRVEPSLNSPVIGLLLYGEMILVGTRSDFMETIDGITNYWYRTWGGYYNGNSYQNSWVFGGYLSATLPADLPVIIGYWDDIDRGGLYFVFTAQNEHWRAAKDTSEVSSEFTWTLDQDLIKLSFNSKIIFTYKIEVIDQNYIILTENDGTVYQLKRGSSR